MNENIFYVYKKTSAGLMFCTTVKATNLGNAIKTDIDNVNSKNRAKYLKTYNVSGIIKPCIGY